MGESKFHTCDLRNISEGCAPRITFDVLKKEKIIKKLVVQVLV